MSWLKIEFHPNGSFDSKCSGGFLLKEKSPCKHFKQAVSEKYCEYLGPTTGCRSFKALVEAVNTLK